MPHLTPREAIRLTFRRIVAHMSCRSHSRHSAPTVAPMPDRDATDDHHADDRRHLRRCVDLARQALDDGDEPFGSVLVDAAGITRFEDRNRVSGGDHTRHPEFEIARWAAANLSADERRTSVVYTSGEHCPMVSAEQLAGWLRSWGLADGPVASLPITAVAPGAEVDGPFAEFTDEVRALHARLHGIEG